METLYSHKVNEAVGSINAEAMKLSKGGRRDLTKKVRHQSASQTTWTQAVDRG